MKGHSAFSGSESSDAISSPGTAIFPLHYVHRVAFGYPCDKIVTRMWRGKIAVVPGLEIASLSERALIYGAKNYRI